MRRIWILVALLLLTLTAGCGSTRSVLVEGSAGGDALARIVGRPLESGDLLEIDLVDGTRLQGELQQVGSDALWLRVFRGPGDPSRPLPRTPHTVQPVAFAEIRSCSLMGWSSWLPFKGYVLLALGLTLSTWLMLR